MNSTSVAFFATRLSESYTHIKAGEQFSPFSVTDKRSLTLSKGSQILYSEYWLTLFCFFFLVFTIYRSKFLNWNKVYIAVSLTVNPDCLCRKCLDNLPEDCHNCLVLEQSYIVWSAIILPQSLSA